MGSVGFAKDELAGLRVVRGPRWKYSTQDGGEGFVGTVIGISKTNSDFVYVRWDSGVKADYYAGVEFAGDLRILDNSAVGVKHPGVKCRGCGQKDIAGMRWQCLDCPTLFDLCTFCFTNGKHDQRYVYFKRYNRPSSVPAIVCVNGKQKIQLKGIFPGALVKRGGDWNYGDEDGERDVIGIDHEFGKVVPVPTGREMTPGKVWVQWPHDEKPFSYRVGFKGKMDLEISSTGFGGYYQPDTLPVLEISKPMADEKTNEAVADLPFVVGDSVKLSVGWEELREMVVDSGVGWGAHMKKIVNMVGTIMKIDKRDDTARVGFPNINNGNGLCTFWFPVKAIQRLIRWLPVGTVVQVTRPVNESTSKKPDDEKETEMMSDFGRVKVVRPCGEKVMLEFLKPDGRVVIKPFHVKQVKVVDVSVNQKVESVRRDLAILLLSEIKKGATLSVQYLMKSFGNMIDCINSRFNDTSYIALKVACLKGHVEIVKLLLKHEESWIEKEEEDGWKEEGVGLIHSSVTGNHPEVLQLLLGNGYNPNYRDMNNDTPLHVAVKSRHLECLRILLKDQLCDPNLKNKSGETAINIAVKYSHLSVEMLQIFLDEGKLDLTNKENKDIVYLATINNNLGAVKFLMSLPEGRKLAQNCCGVLTETSLHASCRSGHNQIAKLLVEQLDKDENGKPWGIDIQVSSSLETGKNSPLMEVIQKSNCELIEILIAAGANLQAINNVGDSAFHYAARFVHNQKLPVINRPSRETSPDIFEIYSKLRTKYRDDDDRCVVTAIVLYIVEKGGIPEHLPFSEIKELVGDDFVYDEITKICHDLDSQIVNSEDNPSQFSLIDDLNETNGVIVGNNPQKKQESFSNSVAHGKELRHPGSTPSTQQHNNGDLSVPLSQSPNEVSQVITFQNGN